MRTVTLELEDDILSASIRVGPAGVVLEAEKAAETESAPDSIRHDTPVDVLVAHAAHEADRAFRRTIGEQIPPWDALGGLEQATAIEAVRGIQSGAFTSPDAMHDHWLATWKDLGWRYGTEASYTLKTHPNIRPYAELTPQRRTQYRLFFAVASALLAPD